MQSSYKRNVIYSEATDLHIKYISYTTDREYRRE